MTAHVPKELLTKTKQNVCFAEVLNDLRVTVVSSLGLGVVLTSDRR